MSCIVIINPFGMSRKRRRVDTDTDFDIDVRGFDKPAPSWARQDPAAIQAGVLLFEYVIMLYSICKISCKDVLVLFYYCWKAGAKGKQFEEWAYAPGKPEGNYAKKFDRMMPHSRFLNTFYALRAPACEKGKRRSIVFKVVPPHTVLEREYLEQDRPRTSEQIAKLVEESSEWGDQYKNHPSVLSRLPDEAPPVPIAMYLDAIHYTRQHGAGRAQSVLPFTIHNLLTMRRHLIGVINKRHLCKCGCRSGVCTLFPIFLFLKWSIEAMQIGRHPLTRHDGSPFVGTDLLSKAARTLMASKFVLVLVKGDWVEYIGSLGFPAFNSIFSPCLFCSSVLDCMHEYADLDVDHDPFPPPVPYDAACCACEIQVLIDTEEKRQGVLVEGGLYYDKRKRSGGRKLAFDVGWLQGTDGRSLKAGDRLHPNHDLIDVGDFRTRVLPMTVVFWRADEEPGSGIVRDSVLWRNPLLSLYPDPRAILCIDTLHAFFLGPCAHFVGYVCWMALTANVYGLRGAHAEQLEGASIK